VLVRPDVAGIGDGRFMVGVDGKFVQDAVENTAGVPSRKLRVNRLP
jgi:hypothetical protein